MSTVRNIHIIMLFVSSISLLTAYIAEYMFYLAPCPLCVYQRFPYLLLLMLALIGLSSGHSYKKYYVVVIVIAIIIAGYHAGVERGVFELSKFCKPLFLAIDNISVAEFKEMLYQKQIGLCNKPALVVFGLSMTEWNLLLNTLLLTILTIFRNYKPNAKTIF